MPRIYPFANALRIRKGIKYDIPTIEGENINLITITPWIELVNKYTQLELPAYTPEDMIKRYIVGEIELTQKVPAIKYIVDSKGESSLHDSEQIIIYSFSAVPKDIKLAFKEDHVTDANLKAFLLDDVVYDSANAWFIVQDWTGISKEILFHYKDKALWYRYPFGSARFLWSHEIKNRQKRATQAFIKFCFSFLDKKEIYRILPKDEEDTAMPIANKIEDLDEYKKYIFYA